MKAFITLFSVMMLGCYSQSTSLRDTPMTSLFVGEIKPMGWLKTQVVIQAEGLSGYLAYFWPNIENSTWIGGGTVDPGEQERVPYWLNGIVPLAILAENNTNLNSQVYKYIDYIITHQSSDGWYNEYDCCDTWPRFPLLMAFIQYWEGNQTDTRVLPSIMAFLGKVDSVIRKTPMTSWAQYRWQDLLLSIYWMYDNAPMGKQEFLLNLAALVQSQGFDWASFYSGSDFPRQACNYTNQCDELSTHGVNNGQALKSSAVWWRQSKDPKGDWNSTVFRVQMLDTYHGQPTGVFSCSENLAGLNPSQGTELCTVVETMFSYEIMIKTFTDVSLPAGDPVLTTALAWADRVERIAYNALPGALDAPMWSHVYLQQSNQIQAAHIDPNIWMDDGPDSNIYGLEPNFGCCTANYHQGFPKFITHMAMKTHNGGLAILFHGPAFIKTTIKSSPVSIMINTSYPFRSDIHYEINSKAIFPLYIRIPGWCNGCTVNNAQVKPGTLFNISIPIGLTKMVLNFPLIINIEKGFNSAAVVTAGPLVFSLNMGEKWTELAHYAYNSSDWQIEPTSPWAYGIHLSSGFSLQYQPISQIPFSDMSPPILVKAMGRYLSDWGIVNNSATPPPQSPVTSTSELEELLLQPYGSLRLRITQIPILKN